MEAEGFESLKEFRRAWRVREKRGFDRFKMVTVYRLRSWTPGTEREMADRLLGHLYGDWLDSPLCQVAVARLPV